MTKDSKDKSDTPDINLNDVTPEEMMELMNSLKLPPEEKSNSLFSITFDLLPNGQIEIQTKSNDVKSKQVDIAKLLFYINNGTLGQQILMAMAIEAEADPDKRSGLTKIVRKWEDLEDKPYVSPLQLHQGEP